MNFVRWSFFVTFVLMIDIKDIPNFVAETDPLFSYICKVANEFWLFYDPDIQELTFSRAPYTFYRRYCNGAINVDRVIKYETSTEVQDTLRAFGIDKDKFWYLCLLIKDYVDGDTIDTIIDNPTHREKLHNLVSEIEKLKPKRWGDLYLTDGYGELTIKTSKHPYIIRDGQTLALIKIAIEEFLKRNQEQSFILDTAPVDYENKTTLPEGYRLYLFDKYLSWFLKDLKANKSLISTGIDNNRVSTDKKLLISRMLFILGITDDEDYYDEFKEVKKEGKKRTITTKIDKLKNTLKNYKGVKVKTHNIYYW